MIRAHHPATVKVLLSLPVSHISHRVGVRDVFGDEGVEVRSGQGCVFLITSVSLITSVPTFPSSPVFPVLLWNSPSQYLLSALLSLELTDLDREHRSLSLVLLWQHLTLSSPPQKYSSHETL